MDIYGGYYEYAGIPSRKYGLIFANFNTERYIALNGNIESNTIFNKGDKRSYHIGELYEDSPIQFDAEIITDNDLCINTFSRREIEKWLFGQTGYKRLFVDAFCDIFGDNYELVNGEPKRLYLNCRFVNPVKIENDSGIIGYKFTVECDSCMAWQEPIVCKYTLDYDESDANTKFVIHVDTDINDYTYPKVTIQIGNTGGDIFIANHTDSPSRLTSFTELPAHSTIAMIGGGINYISGDHYYRFSNKNFIRLLDGNNDFAVTGDVKNITFEFQNRRRI